MAKTSKKPPWHAALFLVELFVLGLVLSALSAYHMRFPHKLWDRLLPLPDGEMRMVVVRPGFNARQCAQAFHDQGALTGSPDELARWMVKLGIDRRIRSGQYRVTRAGPWNLARQLVTARPVSASVTIIPGMDIFSLREVFDLPPPSSRDDSFREAVMENGNYPGPLRDLLLNSEESRVAFLFPETYFLVEKNPEELVQVASHLWWERFGEKLPSLMTSRDLGERATVASMVQREAFWDDERAVIAGVIENRIKKNMELQIDATVIYAWKLRGKNLTRVLYSDLKVNSPYNTYIAPGLPPAPICVPSAESWRAALEPERNQFYYYVARKDGYHDFAATYEEHRRNIKRTRE
ncbi:MAG: endolytic transglycosylase MltG [Synergistaceae bacterium]|nr:endolytic transglycosylase MltG [Synergistaceae bacterium]